MVEGKFKNLCRNIGIILCIVLIVFSLYKIVPYFMDEWKTKKFSDDIQRIAITNGKESPIDFDALKKINQETVAWLYAPDTKINNVVAQGKDNRYYLHHLLNGTKANAGTLFVDAKNKGDFSDWNTIIYGHHMKNGTMFGGLKKYEDQKYYNKHKDMYLYTPKKNYKLQLIAGYTTDTKNRVYNVVQTKEERDEILREARQQSDFSSNVKVDVEDRLVTLSTCAYDFQEARYVVIAKLLEE